jgi:hypothetical protein
MAAILQELVGWEPKENALACCVLEWRLQLSKSGVSIRRFPDYSAFLDRLFWTSSSLDSSVID